MDTKYRILALLIPSYNESENLQLLLPKVAQVVGGAHVFIIDDSPQSEHAKVKKLQKRQGSVSVTVLSRKTKQGRGSAVIAGMRRAMRDPRIRYFIEMDADLAHDPREIPIFLDSAAHSDMVIGSRYMTGSRIRDWPFQRLIQSKIINFFLRFWLGLKISDYTNGYRLYTRKAVEILLHHPPQEQGFIALSEIAYILKRYGLTFSEIPVTFTDRKFGKSNAGPGELARSFAGVIKIRFRQY